MTSALSEQNWIVGWEHEGTRLVRTPFASPGDPIGCLRALDGSWIPIVRISGVQGWIDGPHSGVRVHLDDAGSSEILFYDSGNVDFTATWNEYLFDGGWAFDAGRQLAAWLGVPYKDDWT